MDDTPAIFEEINPQAENEVACGLPAKAFMRKPGKQKLVNRIISSPRRQGRMADMAKNKKSPEKHAPKVNGQIIRTAKKPNQKCRLSIKEID